MNSTATVPSATTAKMSADLGTLITTVTKLLQEEKPQQAIEILHQSRLNSPWVANAIAVCYLRLEQPRIAVDIYRSLVLGPGGITLRRDAPCVLKTNYATALLLLNKVGGCLSILRDLNEHDHPAVSRLRNALAQSLRDLSLWRRFWWYLGSELPGPVALDFPAGDLQ
jgi:hypothetical protein